MVGARGVVLLAVGLGLGGGCEILDPVISADVDYVIIETGRWPSAGDEVPVGVGLVLEVAVQVREIHKTGDDELLAPSIELSTDPAGRAGLGQTTGGATMGPPAAVVSGGAGDATLVKMTPSAPGAARLIMVADTYNTYDSPEELRFRALTIDEVQFLLGDRRALVGGEVAPAFAGSALSLATRYFGGGDQLLGRGAVSLDAPAGSGSSLVGGTLRLGPAPHELSLAAPGGSATVRVVGGDQLVGIAIEVDGAAEAGGPIDLPLGAYLDVQLRPLDPSGLEIIGTAPSPAALTAEGDLVTVSEQASSFLFRADVPGETRLAFTWEGAAAELVVRVAAP